MKTLAFLIVAIQFAATAAGAQQTLAPQTFAPPDLTLPAPAPGAGKAPAASPLVQPKSQWKADDADKPAKSFGQVSNGPCVGCKLSVKARQAPLYPNIGPPGPAWPQDPPSGDEDQ
ncbi:hypothetical protein LMIY3S_02047 [Labrys miyagiensis]